MLLYIYTLKTSSVNIIVLGKTVVKLIKAKNNFDREDRKLGENLVTTPKQLVTFFRLFFFPN